MIASVDPARLQLQAKDNQISNLRERLSRAHDSLEGQRKPKTQAS
jgi:hypothetical protein